MPEVGGFDGVWFDVRLVKTDTCLAKLTGQLVLDIVSEGVVLGKPAARSGAGKLLALGRGAEAT